MRIITIITMLMILLLSPVAMADDIYVFEEDDLSDAVASAGSGDTVYLYGELWSNEYLDISNDSVTIQNGASYTPTIMCDLYSGLILDINYHDDVSIIGINVTGGSQSLDKVGSGFYAYNCDFGNTSNQTVGVSCHFYSANNGNEPLTDVLFSYCSIHDCDVFVGENQANDNLINIDGARSDDGFNEPAGYNITFDNCEIYGSCRHQYYNIQTRNVGSNVTGSNNKWCGVTNITISNNSIHDITFGNAVYTIYGCAENFTFKDNVVDDTISYVIKGSFRNSTFENNTYDNIGGLWAHFLEYLNSASWGEYNSSHVTFKDETILDGSGGARTDRGYDITFDGCNYPQYDPRLCPDFTIKDNTVDFNITSQNYKADIIYSDGSMFSGISTVTFGTSGSYGEQTLIGSSTISKSNDLKIVPEQSDISLTSYTINNDMTELTLASADSTNPVNITFNNMYTGVTYDIDVNDVYSSTINDKTYYYDGNFTSSVDVDTSYNNTRFYSNIDITLYSPLANVYSGLSDDVDDVTDYLSIYINGDVESTYKTVIEDDFNDDVTIPDNYTTVGSGNTLTNGGLWLDTTTKEGVILNYYPNGTKELQFTYLDEDTTSRAIWIFFETDSSSMTGKYIEATANNYAIKMYNADGTGGTDPTDKDNLLFRDDAVLKVKVTSSKVEMWNDGNYVGYWSGTFDTDKWIGIANKGGLTYGIDNVSLKTNSDNRQYATLNIDSANDTYAQFTINDTLNIDTYNITFKNTLSDTKYVLQYTNETEISNTTSTGDPIWFNVSTTDETLEIVTESDGSIGFYNIGFAFFFMLSTGLYFRRK
jgi:hypothetical protein